MVMLVYKRVEIGGQSTASPNTQLWCHHICDIGGQHHFGMPPNISKTKGHRRIFSKAHGENTTD